MAIRNRYIQSISPRRRKLLIEYRKLRIPFLIEHPWCQWPGCQRRSRDVHHTQGKIGLLLLMTHLWKAVCREHHDYLRDHPIEARAKGFLCAEGQWNTIPKNP